MPYKNPMHLNECFRILDLRKCEYKGADLRAKVLAGALMSDADFTGANMQEAVLTKVKMNEGQGQYCLTQMLSI
jgi:uncharacterized protein YjbI with pentapeptide repeats